MVKTTPRTTLGVIGVGVGGLARELLSGGEECAEGAGD